MTTTTTTTIDIGGFTCLTLTPRKHNTFRKWRDNYCGMHAHTERGEEQESCPKRFFFFLFLFFDSVLNFHSFFLPV